MGGTASTVQIWVKAETERIKETTLTSNHVFSASGNISGPAQGSLASVGGDLKKAQNSKYSVEYHELMQSGFTKVKSGKVTPFCPPQDHKDNDIRRVYITIITIDANSEVEVIADRHSCEESCDFIVTKEGCITKARLDLSKPGTKWIDVDGEEQAVSSCPKCLEQGMACTVCLFEEKSKVFKNCILSMKDCKISDGLTTAIAEMSSQNFVLKNEVAKEMMETIKQLASKYFILEGRTKRCVLNIKSYGEGLIESVDDFHEDHDWKSLFWEVQNFDSIEKSLCAVTDIHRAIKGDAEIIQKSANKEHQTAEKKLENAEKGKWTSKEFSSEYAVTALTPGLGQAFGGLLGATIGTAKTLEKIDKLDLHGVVRVPLKFIGGGLAAIGGAAVGTVGFTPFFLYEAFHGIAKIKDTAKYQELSKKFQHMATQMENVGARLDEIMLALEFIDQKFQKSKKAEDKMNFKMQQNADKDMLKMQASRIGSTAKELIESCDNYLGLVKRDFNVNAVQSGYQVATIEEL